MVWSQDQLDRLLAVASPQIGAAVMLALLSGQRQADCLKARWIDIVDGRLRVRQSKTDRALLVPIIGELATMLATLPRTASRRSTNTRGNPWTATAFRGAFREACDLGSKKRFATVCADSRNAPCSGRMLRLRDSSHNRAYLVERHCDAGQALSRRPSGAG